MKKILFLILPIMLLILAGCESGASFRVINRCDYPLYVRVDNGDEVTIPGQEEHSWDIDTKTQYFLTGTVEKKVKVEIMGETYHLFDEYEELWLDDTQIKLKAGETRKAYIWPNRASIKIVNESSQTMTSARIFKHDYVTASSAGVFEELAAGDSAFHRVDYASPGHNFYYYVKVEMEDGETLYYGDEDTVLEKDEQFLITLSD